MIGETRKASVLVCKYSPAGHKRKQTPLGAISPEGDNWHVIEPREIGVLDRIGGGDGL